MAITRYDDRKLVDFFQAQKICMMPELKAALGTSVDRTVRRKLKSLDYRTSYSHRGRVTRWIGSHGGTGKGCGFTRRLTFGTLLKTVELFVMTSEGGYTAGELEAVLGVGVKEPLFRLMEQKRLERGTGALYVYYAAAAEQAQAQRAYRQAEEARSLYPSSAAPRALAVEEIRAAVILFWSLLNEQQRRWYAGLESMKLGAGGDRSLAEFLEVDVGTVARGRKELWSGDILRDRVRRVGGGRVAVEKIPRRDSED